MDQMAQSKQTQKDRLSYPQELRELAYTGQCPRELVEMRIQTGFCRSGVEPSSPSFNVLTPMLLRVIAYIFMSSKEPNYPSPYVDSFLQL